MRRLALALLVTVSTVPALAASPDPAPVRSRFYIFDGSSFEAGAKMPSAELMNPRAAARFGRLMSLKKDLLAGISGTRKDPSFK